jgi:hypothetical protein
MGVSLVDGAGHRRSALVELAPDQVVRRPFDGLTIRAVVSTCTGLASGSVRSVARNPATAPFLTRPRDAARRRAPRLRVHRPSPPPAHAEGRDTNARPRKSRRDRAHAERAPWRAGVCVRPPTLRPGDSGTAGAADHPAAHLGHCRARSSPVNRVTTQTQPTPPRTKFACSEQTSRHSSVRVRTSSSGRRAIPSPDRTSDSRRGCFGSLAREER